MEEIVWEDQFLIGIDEVDRQHMDFVKLLNRIIILSRSDGRIQILDRTLLEVSKYAEYHFVSEENLMILYRYPNLEAHRKEHGALLKKYQSMCLDLKANSIDIHAIVNYLKKWFMHHTQQTDRNFSEYVQNRK